ncbi:MAG: T9SS type A sorting domain-containing protein [Saprospiraceae bacterium]|nr:T9SS type A sorting domain-containing protein [Saprospiraceae bacterium]
MKRFTPSFLLLFFACLFFTAGKYYSNPSLSSSLKMPSGASEENGKLRKAWLKQMLADPATGEIPKGIQFLERQFAASMEHPVANRSVESWVSRGPYNYGGRSRAIVMDVTDENRLIAGSVSGGVWLSENGGLTWRRTTPLNAHPGCVSIAQDTRPGKTNIWYYLSGEVYGASAGATEAFYLGDGMFKSTDGGNTWAPITSTAGGTQQGLSTLYQTGWRVITDPSAPLDQDVVYMATINAIYRSVNGGTNWMAVRAGNLPGDWSYNTDIAITSTGVLYATLSSDGNTKGIWRSTDGTNWTNINPPFMPNAYDRMVVGINPNNENEVYFFGFTPGSGHYTFYISQADWTSLYKYTYQSGDGSGAGGSWVDLSANLPDTGTQLDKCAAQGGYDLVVKVQPGTNHVFIGGTNIWRSTDGFTTPDNTTKIGGYKIGSDLPFFELYPNHHPDIHELLFLPSDNHVLVSASDGGLHRTENCLAPFVEWRSLNNGYVTTQFYTAIIDHNAPGDNMLIGGLQDNGNFHVNSPNPNAQWKQTVNGDGAYGGVAPDKEYYVLSINQGRVAKVQMDLQGNVQAFRRIDPIGPSINDYQFINPLVLDPNNADILYLPAGRKLYRQTALSSIPLTGEWDTIAQGWTLFPDTLVSNTATFTAIAVSTSNPANRVYLGSRNNKLYRIDNAHQGTPSFTALTSPLTNNLANVNCIAIDPRNADRVVVVYSNYNIYSMYLSENGGSTWIKVGGNLEANVTGSGNAPSLRWLSILPLANGKTKYFCGTSIGLFSADTLLLHASGQPGTQWTQEGLESIGTTVVSYVDARASDGLVVAATHGNGMFTTNFQGATSGFEPGSRIAVKVSPNPASSFANFDLGDYESSSEVQLYDLKGRLMRQIRFNGSQNRLALDGLPKGVYIWTLHTGNARTSGKLVVE